MDGPVTLGDPALTHRFIMVPQFSYLSMGVTVLPSPTQSCHLGDKHRGWGHCPEHGGWALNEQMTE